MGMGPIYVVGLMYCGTCLRLRPKHVYDEDMRVRCATKGCEAYMRTIRLPSLVKPAMAAYALGGMPALRQVLIGHPRVTCHRSDPGPVSRNSTAWMQFVPWCPRDVRKPTE